MIKKQAIASYVFGFAAFCRVISGLDVVQKIRLTDNKNQLLV